MTDIEAGPMLSEPLAEAAHLPPPPAPRHILRRVRVVWAVGLTIFGYGPAFTYGWLTWLMNEHQWFWTYTMYLTLVPLIGGLCVFVLPSIWYRPIHRALVAWSSGTPVDRRQCLVVYERAIHLPGWVALGSVAAATLGYLLGTSVVHWKAQQPLIEMIPKTLPAIPVVGGMMGAFCYFGTIRALHSVLAWCSVQLRHARPVQRISLAAKFLATTYVLILATVCLLLPAAYRLGQVIVEEQLKDRTLEKLQLAVYRAELMIQPQDKLTVLQKGALGAQGYVLVADAQGRLLTPHPRGYTQLTQERFYDLERLLEAPRGSWVDRVAVHRVVALTRLQEPEWSVVSVAFPDEFSAPLRHFVRFSWVAILEILFLVVLFGRYYTRSITIPLAELTRAAHRIADEGDLSHYVPVTTNDELSEVARAFNRMVGQLRASTHTLEEYTRKLERSTQELTAVNQEMEDLLRVVSHDLRAPLINIQGFSKRLEPVMQETLQTLDRMAAHSQDNGVRQDVAALRGAVHHRFTESLGFISKGVEKMDTLLSSLLAVSRVGRKADPLAPNDLNAIVDDVLATLDHQLKERSIQIIRHPLPAQVPCRRNEINQVFSNLISNAINYMGPSERRCIEIGATEAEDHVECFVRDTGVGISPEDRERVFQMFTRLHAVDAPGEGVGLAYVKKILRSHGGRIWVTSARGQGSTFFFTLPTMTRG